MQSSFVKIQVGRDFGARNVGMLTQRFMRIEKFIPFWAEDLNSETTPFETGSGYLVKLDVCEVPYFQRLQLKFQNSVETFLLHSHRRRSTLLENTPYSVSENLE